jgi:hypothetical protein
MLAMSVIGISIFGAPGQASSYSITCPAGAEIAVLTAAIPSIASSFVYQR